MGSKHTCVASNGDGDDDDDGDDQQFKGFVSKTVGKNLKSEKEAKVKEEEVKEEDDATSVGAPSESSGIAARRRARNHQRVRHDAV